MQQGSEALDLSINNIRSFKQRRKNNNISPPIIQKNSVMNGGVVKKSGAAGAHNQRKLQKCRLKNGGPLLEQFDKTVTIQSPIDIEAAANDNSEDFLMDCVEKLTDEVAGIKRTLVELPQRILSGLHVFIQSEIESQFQILQDRVTSHVSTLVASASNNKTVTNLQLDNISIEDTANNLSANQHVTITPLPVMPKYIQAPVQIRIEDLRSDCHVHRVKILDCAPPSDVFEQSDDFIYRVFLKYKYPSIFVQALFVLHFGSYKAMHLNTSSRVKNNLELIPENFVTRLTLLVVRWFPSVEDLDFGKCLNQKQRSILSAARSCLFFKKCDSCKSRNIDSLPSTYMKISSSDYEKATNGHDRNSRRTGGRSSPIDIVKMSEFMSATDMCQAAVNLVSPLEDPLTPNNEDLVSSIVDELSIGIKEEMSPESITSSNAENFCKISPE